jgi:D-alanyl-D-alanine carboxypeptidase
MKCLKLFILNLLLSCVSFYNMYATTLYVLAADEPVIYSDAAVVMDADTGIILYDKNMDERKYPASTTKIMTALLTLEAAEDELHDRVWFSHQAVYSMPPGSSHIAMDEEESLTVRDALYGLLLASANEVATALGEYVSGSEAEFAELMTARAKELSANSTNFINAHGFYDEDHYTTAHDMALIMREVVKHQDFVDIISSLHYEIPPTEKQKEIRYLNNSNKMIFENNEFYIDSVIGSKTGYTSESNHTLVSYARVNGRKFIVVTMDGLKNEPYMDTKVLLEYVESLEYKDTKIFDSSKYISFASVISNEDNKNVEVVAKENLLLYLPDDIDVNNISRVQVMADEIYAPVKKDDMLGKLSFIYKDVEIASAALYANEDVDLDVPGAYIMSNEEPRGLELKTLGTVVISLIFATVLIIYLMRIRRYMYIKRIKHSRLRRLKRRYLKT